MVIVLSATALFSNPAFTAMALIVAFAVMLKGAE
jgi:hypothetical protein